MNTPTTSLCCERFKNCCARAHGALNRMQCLLLLALRLYFGITLAFAGLGKLNNLERTVGFFEKLAIPAPYWNAIAAGSIELICGALLALGLFSRIAAIPVIIVMCVAYCTAHPEELGLLFAEPSKFLAAPPFLYLLTALLVLLFGPGRISLDFLCKRRCCKTSGAPLVCDTNAPCCSV